MRECECWLCMPCLHDVVQVPGSVTLKDAFLMVGVFFAIHGDNRLVFTASTS